MGVDVVGNCLDLVFIKFYIWCCAINGPLVDELLLNDFARLFADGVIFFILSKSKESSRFVDLGGLLVPPGL